MVQMRARRPSGTQVACAPITMHIALLFVAVSLFVSTPPAAQARITGTVVGHLREPVPAAQIRIELAGEVVARASADGSGVFAVSNLPFGDLYVFADVPGHTLGFDHCLLREIDPEGVAELRVHEAGSVSGTVTDERGEPVAGAHVQTDNDVSFMWYIREYRRDERTDERGRFAIDRVLLGSTTLRVWAPGKQVLERRIYVRGNESADVALRPADGQSLTVTLAGTRPEQLRDATVRLVYRRGHGDVGMPVGLTSVPLDADGAATVTGLPRDLDARISIRAPGLATDPAWVEFDEAPSDDERVRHARFEIATQPDVEIAGRVSSVGGEPMRDMALLLQTWGAEPAVRLRTDADGAFHVRVPWRRAVVFFVMPEAENVVFRRVGNDDHSAFRGWVRGIVGNSGEFDAVAMDGLQVRTRVVDEDGRPVSGLRVILCEKGESMSGPAAVTDREGRASFDRVGGGLPGDFWIAHDGVRGTVRSETFALARDGVQNIGRLTLKPSVSIGGVVFDAAGEPRPGARVAIRWCDPADGSGTGGGLIETVADGRGRFRFAGLRARGWRLFVYPAGERDRDVPGPWFEPGPGARIDTELRLDPR